ARGVSFEEAEAEKLDPAAERDVFAVIRPVADKMASIVARFLEAYPDLDSVHIVGGACSFSDFEQVFAKQTGRRIVKPAEPLLVTPLGIAMFPQATGEK
ncbi:ethanolamine utilization protein EutJ, partial [Rhodovulum sulfidophilum]|nr:ethanolamine utilization protein EutJ [Rhodovulum sulfidophilum]